MNDAPVPNIYNTEDISGGTFDTPKKEVPQYSRREILLSAAVAVLSFLFVKYIIFNITGFFTTGVFIALITAATVYLRKKGFKFSRLNIAIAVILYIFSFVFSITANSFIKGLNTVFLCAASAYYIYSVAAEKRDIERFLPFAMIKAVFAYPFSKFGAQSAIAADSLKKSKVSRIILPVFIGLLLTVPLTAVVGALLMSADDGLARMLSGLTNRIFSYKLSLIAAELMLTIPCSLYIFGMIYANSFRKDISVLDDEQCANKLDSARVISNLIVYTAVTPICILYVMFFISQAGYFLSAFANSLPEGYSYADYARQGFFELFAVSLINLMVITVMSLHSKKSGRNKSAALKFYNVMLSIFTLILIATAISKMVMYISVYGLTQLRFYTTWFMLLLAVIFVMIIVKQFRYDFRFARHISIAFTIMFGFLCFSRPDSIIAAYNIEMYNAGYLNELDTSAIMELSDDAVLTAFNKGAVSAKDAEKRFERRLKSDTFNRYNISTMMLEK